MVYIFNRKFPEKDELVAAKIVSENKQGVVVELPDYNDINGFVSIGLSTRARKKNQKCYIGQETILLVLSVDEAKGFIDLSKHNISKEELDFFKNKNKTHYELFSFFKYIYFKLKNYESMSEIVNEELEQFMVHTLWEIQSKHSDNQTIRDYIFNKDKNDMMLEDINYQGITYNLSQIKSIVDNFIDTKLNKTKASAKKEFKILSYNPRGVSDIKFVTDFKSFDFYNRIEKDYKIRIVYETNTLYTIYVEEIEHSDKDINETLMMIYDEVKNRSSERQIIFIE